MCEGIKIIKRYLLLLALLLLEELFILFYNHLLLYTVLVFILASDHRSSIRVFIISTIVKSMIESSYILASLPSSFYARAPSGRDGT